MEMPAEARATLSNINPARDLGWLNERGRSFFWREVAASDHMLGDAAAERATAERMKSAGGTALAYAYFTARSMAEQGKTDSALLTLQSIKSAANDPALLSGLTSGRLNAVHLASPGWVMFKPRWSYCAADMKNRRTQRPTWQSVGSEQKGSVSSLPIEQQWVWQIVSCSCRDWMKRNGFVSCIDQGAANLCGIVVWRAWSLRADMMLLR